MLVLQCGSAPWQRHKCKQKAAPLGERPRWFSADRPAPKRRALCRLDVVDGDLAGAAVFGRVKGNLLAFDEAAHAGALKSGGMDEHILAAVARLDEAEAFLIVVEFYGARVHGRILWLCVSARELEVATA